MSQIVVVTGVVRGDVRRAVVRGSKVTRFGIPTGSRDASQWFNCSVWGDDLRNITDALVPGSNVTVSGTIRVGIWRDQNGESHPAAYLRVSTIQFLSGMGRGEDQQASKFASTVEEEDQIVLDDEPIRQETAMRMPVLRAPNDAPEDVASPPPAAAATASRRSARYISDNEDEEEDELIVRTPVRAAFHRDAFDDDFDAPAVKPSANRASASTARRDLPYETNTPNSARRSYTDDFYAQPLNQNDVRNATSRQAQQSPETNAAKPRANTSARDKVQEEDDSEQNDSRRKRLRASRFVDDEADAPQAASTNSGETKKTASPSKAAPATVPANTAPATTAASSSTTAAAATTKAKRTSRR